MNNKVFKKAILILACLGIAVGGAFSFVSFDVKKELEVQEEPIASKDTNEEEISFGDERFAAQFPNDPVKNEKQLNIDNTIIEFDEFSSEVDQSFYAVSYIDFPGKWKLLGTDKLLTQSFEKMMEQEENLEEILIQELSTHNGHPSLDYHIKQAGKEVKGKLVIAGNTLYRVTITYPLTAAGKLKPNDFLESFYVNS